MLKTFISRSKLFCLFLFFAASSIPAYAEPFREYYLLQKYRNSIKKTSDGYLVESKKTKVPLKNCTDEGVDSWAKYSLHDVINDRYVIFYVMGYEWPSYDMVDLLNGEILSTAELPHFSPDLTRIVSVNADQMESSSSIELYESIGGKFQKVFSPAEGEFNLPEFHSWNGNNQVRIKDDVSWYQNNMVNMILSLDESSKKWSYKKATEPFLSSRAADDFTARFPDIINSFGDKKLALELFKEEGADAAYLNEKLRDDKDVMKAAIKSSDSNAKYLSRRLKDDSDFMTSVIRISEGAFQFASERLRFNRDFVVKGIEVRNTASQERDVQFLPYTSDKIRDDEDIIKAAIAKSDKEFRYVSKRIKDKVDSNPEFAKSLLAINCQVFEHFPKKSRDNKELLLVAENKGKCDFTASKEILGD